MFTLLVSRLLQVLKETISRSKRLSAPSAGVPLSAISTSALRLLSLLSIRHCRFHPFFLTQMADCRELFSSTLTVSANQKRDAACRTSMVAVVSFPRILAAHAFSNHTTLFSSVAESLVECVVFANPVPAVLFEFFQVAMDTSLHLIDWVFIASFSE